MKSTNRLGCYALLTAATLCRGDFVLVEDFESVADWDRQGSAANTLVANAGVGELLMVDNTSTSHFLGLGANAIADGNTGTIFFQILTPAAGATLDHYAGFTVANAPVAYSGYNGYVFSSNNGGGPFTLQARNGTGADATTDSLAVSSTYNVWMVVNNSAKTYDVHVNTGTSAATAGDLVWSGLAFRTNTSPAGEAVDTFGLFGQDAQNTNRTLSFDNLYVDNSGVNLSYAVPEPGTLALLGIALGGMLLFRRRR